MYLKLPADLQIIEREDSDEDTPAIAVKTHELWQVLQGNQFLGRK